MRSFVPWTLLAVLVMATGGAIALALAQRSHQATPRFASPSFTPAPEAARYPGCHAGVFAMTASHATLPPSVCVRTGATLFVTFDKSPGGLGRPGPWTIPPVAVDDRSILGLRSTLRRGQLLTAVLGATTPGSTAVSAHFDEECSGPQVTPCTIPPQDAITANVTVSP